MSDWVYRCRSCKNLRTSHDPEPPKVCKNCGSPKIMLEPIIEEREDGFWIVFPDASLEVDDIGPCSTEKRAKSAVKGIQRFIKYADKPNFITCEEEE